MWPDFLFFFYYWWRHTWKGQKQDSPTSRADQEFRRARDDGGERGSAKKENTRKRPLRRGRQSFWRSPDPGVEDRGRKFYCFEGDNQVYDLGLELIRVGDRFPF